MTLFISEEENHDGLKTYVAVKDQRVVAIGEAADSTIDSVFPLYTKLYFNNVCRQKLTQLAEAYCA